MRDFRLTEQRNPKSTRVDTLDVLGIVDLINTEDRMVAAAVGGEREAIARAIELVEEAFRAGLRREQRTTLRVVRRQSITWTLARATSY